MARIQRGENFTIDIHEGLAYARIFKREDTSHSDGAKFAETFAETFARVLSDTAAKVTAGVIDLRQAPLIAGPITMGAVGKLLATWERAGKRLAIVVGDEAIKAAQYRTAVSRHAPKFARVVADQGEAQTWCER